MPKSKGYIDPLLSGFAVDYSERLAKGLVGHRLFPRVPVEKPDDKYAYFGLDSLVVPDTSLAKNGGRPHRVGMEGEEKTLSCAAHGLQDGFDIEDMQYREGPFALKEKTKVQALVRKLEVAQEVRIREVVLNESGRYKTLSGTGSALGNKWPSSGGKPYDEIRAAIDNILFAPNMMIISKDVWRVMQGHSDFTGRVGEVQNTKRVTIQTIADLFEIETVLVTDGIVGPAKKNKNGTSMSDLSQIWQNCLVLAYVDDKQNDLAVNRAGSTFQVKDSEADGSGYVVTTWDDKEAGVKGERIVKVATRTDERVVSPELLYSLKSLV